MTGHERNPFELPAAPRDGLDLIRWTLFEYQRLDRYGKTLSRRRFLVLYLSAAPWVCLLAAALWLLNSLLVVGLELPLIFPAAVDSSLKVVLASDPTFIGRLTAVLEYGWAPFLSALALILPAAAPGLLILSLAWGLAWGLVGGLAVGLAVGLARGLAWGLVWGLAGGLAAGPAAGPAAGLAEAAATGLGVGLAFGLALGLQSGLWSGLGIAVGFAVGWLLGFYRLPFYLVQAPLALLRLDLRHNPYLWDSAVRLPIWRARRRLADQAAADPETGAAFAAFLLEHRPLQRGLAAELLHAVTAGRWARAPLDHLALTPPPLVEGEPRFRPSETWLGSLAELRAQLETALQESQISFRRLAFAEFAARLDAFRDQTLRESPVWAGHYRDALERWCAEAAKELTRIEDQARVTEPITPNVYRPGSPLRPGQDADLFLGREDLRHQLTREVRSARELPLLLIQGQRRVGKTSLLNFLPGLLGAGFRVVFQDMQGAAVTSVPDWLADLRRRAAEALALKPDDWEPPGDWVAAWGQLEPWLKAQAERAHCRLILAFDEYETLHRYLARDPEAGRRLLAAMRSFSQHQTQVCLLFAGATPFSELRNPDWSEFFVQALRLRVDYLGRADSLRLITAPVPRLRYPPEVQERLFALTQGHPALLQLLCKHLVDIANTAGRRAMTMADLDAALVRGIDRETAAMERFWNEFCAAPGCRACVDDLLAGRAPADRAALIRLSEHGYLVERDGGWHLRVPLFEDWLRRFREGFAPSCA